MPPERRMTEAEIRRKTNKPIMEKKRRERINKCLDDLKSMVQTTMSENVENGTASASSLESRPNKLEKADILELTVQYLKKLQAVTQINPDLASDAVDGLDNKKRLFSNSAHTQQRGYAHCVHEVTSFLSKTEGIPVEFRTQLLGHLADQSRRRIQANESEKRMFETFSSDITSFSCRNIPKDLTGHRSSESLSSDRSFHNPTSFQSSLPEHTDIVQPKVSPMPRDHLSPAPLSPTSYESSFSPISCPSPTTFPSRRNGNVDTQEDKNNNVGTYVNYHCLNDQATLQHLKLPENNHLQDVSSDSGNWSSCPNSPVKTISSTALKISTELFQNETKTPEDEDTTQSLNTVWRPWSL